MNFESAQILGVWHILPECHCDERGYFARTRCVDEFQQRGLDPCTRQCNVSFNAASGTLRGMHMQLPPHPETKLVCCTAGAIYDVVVDMRPESKTYLKWQAFVLSARDANALYIPARVAHGFQTLEPGSQVFYQMSESYYPELSIGFRYNDRAFGIRWPLPVNVISARDAQFPLFSGEIADRLRAA